MRWDQLELHPRIKAALKRAEVATVRDLLCLSGPDLQRLAGLSLSDVRQLLSAAATACRHHQPIPALQLHRGECTGSTSGRSLSLGCPLLDQLLRGGLPVGGIIELSGASGAGKTQLALQLCLAAQYPAEYGGLDSGALYVCTEDRFPSRRLQQLIEGQTRLRSDVPQHVTANLHYSDGVFVEHAADLASLQSCLSRRVPLLLARRLVSLLVLDSVASLFRAEFAEENWQERSVHLMNISSSLHHLRQQFNTTVFCINQVSDVFNSSNNILGPLSSNLSPALGLAWANQVTVRLMMHRLEGTVARGDQRSALRRLEVVSAPHLARGSQLAAVWREGVQGTSGVG